MLISNAKLLLTIIFLFEFLMNNIFKNILKLLIGVAFLGYILNRIGLTELIHALSSMDLFYFLFAILTFLILLAIGAFNLYILFRGIRFKLPFIKLLKYSLLSWSIGMFVPGKLGEFSLAYFLKKRRLGFGKSIAVMVCDKVITLFTLAILSVLGFFLFLSAEQALYLSEVFILLFLGYIFLIVSNFGRSLLKSLIPKKFLDNLQNFSSTLFFLWRHNKEIIFLNIILTFIKWSLSGFFYYLLFLSFGIKLDFIIVYLFTAMITVISLVPVSFSGLGVRESSIVFLYNLFNIAEPISLAVGLVATATSYGLSILFLSSLKWK